MRRLAAFVAIACGTVLAVTAARAETLDDLKGELAAKKADVAKLERRIRQMEGKAPANGGVSVTTNAGVLPLAPVAAPKARPPTTAVAAAAPPPEDQELERALERTLVREGALVLPTWGFQLTPQFSYAHWDKIQDPFISNSYSGALSVAMGLPWRRGSSRQGGGSQRRQSSAVGPQQDEILRGGPQRRFARSSIRLRVHRMRSGMIA